MGRSDIGVFLDRDGTVNVEIGYLKSPEQLALIPRSAEAIRGLRRLGVKIFIVTNQSGIARGFLTEENTEKIHDALRALLRKEGAEIDGIYFCPHFPGSTDPRYNLDCDCRKPKPGLLFRAAAEHQIDLSTSFVIGDKCSDIEAGLAAGTSTVMVATGYGSEEINRCRTKPDLYTHDLYDAMEYVKQIILNREAENS
jgi:D-glycero-D-manno-heptose 1,7-bisphosphate phosphatase